MAKSGFIQIQIPKRLATHLLAVFPVQKNRAKESDTMLRLKAADPDLYEKKSHEIEELSFDEFCANILRKNVLEIHSERLETEKKKEVASEIRKILEEIE